MKPWRSAWAMVACAILFVVVLHREPIGSTPNPIEPMYDPANPEVSQELNHADDGACLITAIKGEGEERVITVNKPDGSMDQMPWPVWCQWSVKVTGLKR